MIEPAIELPPTDEDRDTSDLPPKVRAWTLYCQGYHSPEIGHLLGIPERTIRSWLSRALSDLDAEHAELKSDALTIAIARQRQIAAAAWQGYEQAQAIAQVESAKATNTDSPANARTATLALATALRYLSLAAVADRELARLHAALSHEDSLPIPTARTAERPTMPDQAEGVGATEAGSTAGSTASSTRTPHETAAKTAIAPAHPLAAAHLSTEIPAISAKSVAQALHMPEKIAAKPSFAAKTAILRAAPHQHPQRRIALRYAM